MARSASATGLADVAAAAAVFACAASACGSTATAIRRAEVRSCITRLQKEGNRILSMNRERRQPCQDRVLFGYMLRAVTPPHARTGPDRAAVGDGHHAVCPSRARGLPALRPD